MATTYVPQQRQRFFTGPRGRLAIEKDKDTVESFTLDWSRELASGETISTSSWSVSGAVEDSESNTTTTSTVTISKTGGEAECTVTTSASRTLVRTFDILEVQT